MVAAGQFDGNLLTAMSAAAKLLDPSARAFSTSNPDALAAWGRTDYERAAALDPDFGAAWLAWTESLAAAGEVPRAIEVAARALDRPALRSEYDRAQIEFVSAGLRKDEQARKNALASLVRLTHDTSLMGALAELETNARRYAAAADLYRNILRLEPDNAPAMNSLGYAEAFAGNLEPARRAFEDYRKQPGQEPNALDSLGEAHFMNGRFKDAEKYFLQAHERDAAFLAGADLLKAAYAHWLGGDLNGADGLMRQYLQFRGNLRDPLLAWREAVWLYSTGRREQATAKLESAPASEAQVAVRQLNVWRGATSASGVYALLLQKKFVEAVPELKQAYEHTQPAADGQLRTFYAWALYETGRKDEARQLLTRWPLPESTGDPLFGSLVYPRFIELRRLLSPAS